MEITLSFINSEAGDLRGLPRNGARLDLPAVGSKVSLAGAGFFNDK
jgi:hypothetical protein